MRLSSRRHGADRMSPATLAVPLGLPDETPRATFGGGTAGRAGPLTEERAGPRLGAEIGFVPHPSFDDPAMHPEILGPAPAPSGVQPTPRFKPPAGFVSYLAGLDSSPLLTREQEGHLFRKMNFLKHRAAHLRGAINPAEAADFGLIEALQGEALAVKNQIVLANLRLVVSFVKKLIRPGQDFAELVSEGYFALIRAVEKFDFSRGNRFGTYASWAIMNGLLRDPPRDRRRDRLITGHEAMLEAVPDYRVDGRQSESDQPRLQEAVRGMLGRLDDRERRIIVGRFGLEGTHEKTLDQLGKELGVSKERIRQIENRARGKLRQFAEELKFVQPAS
jgi:RNA polymerase primary sigma factor